MEDDNVLCSQYDSDAQADEKKLTFLAAGFLALVAVDEATFLAAGFLAAVWRVEKIVREDTEVSTCSCWWVRRNQLSSTDRRS